MTSTISADDPRPWAPIGWYKVVAAEELAAGEVRELLWCGEPVVAFRTASGEVGLAEAHCPHLGANLGRGGTVVGEGLRCPFHGLQWGTDGRCVGGAGAEESTYPLCLRTFRVIERFGFLFGWYEPDSAEKARSAEGPRSAEKARSAENSGPSFDIPDLEFDGWTDAAVTSIPIATHVENVHENGADRLHFGVVHGFPLSGTAYEERGPSFHSEFHFSTPNFLREGPSEITTFFDTDTYGLGYAHSLNTAEAVGLQYRVLLLTTPMEVGRIDFTVVTSVRRPETGDRIAGVPVEEVADFMHRGAVGGVRQDVPIWEGLRYVAAPRLIKGDGPIPRFRRWAAQFHPAQFHPAQSRRA